MKPRKYKYIYISPKSEKLEEKVTKLGCRILLGGYGLNIHSIYTGKKKKADNI